MMGYAGRIWFTKDWEPVEPDYDDTEYRAFTASLEMDRDYVHDLLTFYLQSKLKDMVQYGSLFGSGSVPIP